MCYMECYKIHTQVTCSYLEGSKVTSHFNISSWRYYNILTSCLLTDRENQVCCFLFPFLNSHKKQLSKEGSSQASTNNVHSYGMLNLL